MLFMMSSQFFHWSYGQTVPPCMHAGDMYIEMFAKVYSMGSCRIAILCTTTSEKKNSRRNIDFYIPPRSNHYQ